MKTIDIQALMWSFGQDTAKYYQDKITIEELQSRCQMLSEEIMKMADKEKEELRNECASTLLLSMTASKGE